MVCQGGVLKPAAPADEEVIETLPGRKLLSVTISHKANRLSAWYWVMVRRLVGMTGMWPSVDQAHRHLLLRCGFYESITINESGGFRLTPVSTSDWDYDEWRAYVDALMAKLSTEIISEIQNERLRESVEAMTVMSFEEARKVA